jgi:branched-chain amino acid transport system permease protein
VRRWTAPLAILLVGGAGIAVGSGLDEYQLDLGVTLLIYLVIAQAWNVLAGFSGQVSLGAASFVGLSAYATTLLMVKGGFPWPIGVLGAGVVGVLGASILAIPLLRLRGDYFAVGTLAASLSLQALVINWAWAGGSSGLVLPLDHVPSGAALYRLTVVLAVLALGVTLWIQRSDFGLRLASVRDHESAAAGVGVPVLRYRFAALLISSTLTALAGSAVAFQAVAVVPDGVASFGWSLNAVLMTIVGGPGSLLGPAVGVLVVYYGLTKQLEGLQTISLIIEGVLLITIVRFAPEGVWPWTARMTRTAWRRLISDPPSPPDDRREANVELERSPA